jgi:hypothetical protein
MLCVALAVAAPAWAQSPESPTQRSAAVDPGDYGSVYLWIGHWINDCVDVLVAGGALGDLSPLVQPYRRIDVAARSSRRSRVRGFHRRNGTGSTRSSVSCIGVGTETAPSAVSHVQATGPGAVPGDVHGLAQKGPGAAS